MGSLSDTLKTVPTRPKIPGCRIVRILTEMKDDERFDDEDIESLAACVNSPDYPPSAIAKLLRPWGYEVDSKVIQKHREHGDVCRDQMYPAG